MQHCSAAGVRSRRSGSSRLLYGLSPVNPLIVHGLERRDDMGVLPCSTLRACSMDCASVASEENSADISALGPDFA